jgi:hypothetical protein
MLCVSILGKHNTLSQGRWRMNRIFGLLFLCLFLVACNKDGSSTSDSSCASGSEAQEAGTDCSLVTDPPLTGDTTGGTTEGTTGTTTGGTTAGSAGTGLPNAAYTFDINIKFINTTVSQQEKFDKAIDMIKQVVATEDFRSKVLNHTYSGKKTFVDNRGYTNAQIYQHILDGAEKLFPTKNNAIDMEVELYYANNSTVGYTYANSKRVWVNTKFFNTNSISAVATNLFHEWLHKVGYGHEVSYSVSRDYSVPYGVGRILGNIGKTL